MNELNLTMEEIHENPGKIKIYYYYFLFSDN